MPHNVIAHSLMYFLLPNPPNHHAWWRYGDDASQATDTAIKSVVNVGITAYNIDNLGIKAILKTTGKQTAKAMVKSSDGKEVKETRVQEGQHHQEKTNGNEVQNEDKKK